MLNILTDDKIDDIFDLNLDIDPDILLIEEIMQKLNMKED